MIIFHTDPGFVPWDWLMSKLADGYLSVWLTRMMTGWLQPNVVSQLATFFLARHIPGPMPLGDMLLIVKLDCCRPFQTCSPTGALSYASAIRSQTRPPQFI
ncbi:hypothetical protein VP01_457g2 [Puccinia sorghi]|uniref:Uncharacterized protein n=1 Tax=Puccinia sorghi TaxID=27349 RepID=A0A0L6UNL1_9BASI|nr:hypothetical protein VP01_457g2 [Puccinia sorghi]